MDPNTFDNLSWQTKMKIALALIGLLLLFLAGCANMTPAETAIVQEAEKDLIGAGEQIAEQAIKDEIAK